MQTKENSFSNTLKRMQDAFAHSIERFPITIGFAVALTLFGLYLVHTEMSGAGKLMGIIVYYLSVGMVLSLTLQLWREEVSSPKTVLITNVVAHLVLIVDGIFLYYSIKGDNLSPEIMLAHVAAIFTLILSLFFLSFFHEKNDVPSWNFALWSITTFIVVWVVGWVMTGGLSALAYSLESLFGINVSPKIPAYLGIIFGGLLPFLMFICLLPEGENKHNTTTLSIGFVNGVLRFLILPLSVAYIVVLYLYGVKILIEWQLPNGWVSWLVVVLMILCIIIQFGLYPARIKDHKRMDELITRWLPIAILPLLVLMTIGIIRRFSDYGVTVPRLYLITLNIWFYMVCLWLFITRARRISWIAISFAALFLLTSVFPVNYTSITRNLLSQQIEQAFTRYKHPKLPLNKEQYRVWLRTMPTEEAHRVNDKLNYVDDWFEREDINKYVTSDVNLYRAADVRAESVWEKEINYDINANEYLNIPAGYSKMAIVRYCSHNFEHYSNVVKMPVGNKKDTVIINLDVLKKVSDNKQPMSQVMLKCTDLNAIFVLTSFYMNYDDVPNADLTIRISGYLFKK